MGSSTSSEEYQLVFEGPQDDSEETLRALKGVFIADLNFPIEDVQKFFESASSVIKTSPSQDDLESIRLSLEKAGGKVLIVSPSANALNHLLDLDLGAAPASATPKPPETPANSSSEFILEFDLSDLHSPDDPAPKKPVEPKEPSKVYVLSEEDTQSDLFEQSLIHPQGEPQEKNNPLSFLDESPPPGESLFDFAVKEDGTTVQEKPAAQSETPAPPTPKTEPAPAANDDFSLEFGDLEPAPVEKAAVIPEPTPPAEEPETKSDSFDLSMEPEPAPEAPTKAAAPAPKPGGLHFEPKGPAMSLSLQDEDDAPAPSPDPKKKEAAPPPPPPPPVSIIALEVETPAVVAPPPPPKPAAEPAKVAAAPVEEKPKAEVKPKETPVQEPTAEPEEEVLPLAQAIQRKKETRSDAIEAGAADAAMPAAVEEELPEPKPKRSFLPSFKRGGVSKIPGIDVIAPVVVGLLILGGGNWYYFSGTSDVADPQVTQNMKLMLAQSNAAAKKKEQAAAAAVTEAVPDAYEGLVHTDQFDLKMKVELKDKVVNVTEFNANNPKPSELTPEEIIHNVLPRIWLKRVSVEKFEFTFLDETSFTMLGQAFAYLEAGNVNERVVGAINGTGHFDEATGAITMQIEMARGVSATPETPSFLLDRSENGEFIVFMRSDITLSKVVPQAAETASSAASTSSVSK